MTDTASPSDGQTLSDSDGACEPVGWADAGGSTFSGLRGGRCWASFLSPTYVLRVIDYPGFTGRRQWFFHGHSGNRGSAAMAGILPLPPRWCRGRGIRSQSQSLGTRTKGGSDA